MTRSSVFVVSLLLTVTAPPIHAQMWDRVRTPQITVAVQHAPVVKVPLEHVAFAEPQGNCADALSDALVADFAASGVTVVDRAHLKAIAAEHKLNVSGMVDEKTAAKIGQLIGTGALIFVKVHNCGVTHTQQARDYTDKNGATHRTYITKTRGALQGSIQATNLTTGITVAARIVNSTVSLPKDDDTNASFASRLLSATTSALVAGNGNDTPPDDVITNDLQNDAVAQVHRMFFSWTEPRKLHFYNDKDCSLYVAYNLLRGSDTDGAARESQTSLETCKTTAAAKPAVLAHAFYNVGMTQFITENYPAALEALGQALRLDGGDIITDAMTEVRRAQALAKEMSALPPAVSSVGLMPSRVALPQPPAQTSGGGAEDRLRKLNDLHQKKIITDEEYKAKRAEILKDM